ncbi:biotin-dependent carboxyltransferase family protein [Orbaceae bacterium ESL0721]|nr:biotin-dependent carboxyltransferase family protein [Orbaceae bacterium ESL0721]
MLTVIKAGLLTTVQDSGRIGYRKLGIGQSGALDLPALHIANLLVGNPRSYAGLEITLGQFSAQFEQDCWIALTGADCNATLDDKPLWSGWRYFVRKGQQLILQQPLRGMRSYLAISGGIDVPVILGSRSTDLMAKFGGFEGRVLQNGDTLPIGKAVSVTENHHFNNFNTFNKSVGVKQLPFDNRFRVLAGPEMDQFSQQSQTVFWRNSWQISPNSNRMGFRLNGGELKRTCDSELLSHGVLAGVIQVPHNGQPIILLSDAQTTGGYPRIGTIIAADLYRLAQIPLGESIHFIPCTLAEAEKAWVEQQRFINQIEWGLYADRS